jgi:hypothetical protein
MIVVADKTGKELRELVFSSYDIECGEDENSFLITILRNEYETIPEEARLYIPGTEFGGIFRELDTDTKTGTISPGGITWRGMMQKKIIEPSAGQDYRIVSGELNAIIKQMVEAAFPGMFIGDTTDTGIVLANYQFERYCTLEYGLRKMLKSAGYRMEIAYSQPDKAVKVSAVPIVNWSSNVEFSSDLNVNYLMHMQGDGVNHLICLGKGELKDRAVVHLYVDSAGEISQTQYYTGADEITEIYDYAGAELPDLIASGTERLRQLTNSNTFTITVDPTIEVAIGDIVGGRDYLSGMTMSAPVAGKIVRWANGFQSIEYKIKDDVTASL